MRKRRTMIRRTRTEKRRYMTYMGVFAPERQRQLSGPARRPAARRPEAGRAG